MTGPGERPDPTGGDGWASPFEAELRAVAPALLDAQRAWLSQIDSVSAPDRKTHELIRTVCSVIARNPQGVERHAMLAAEFGATWEEVIGSIVLTQPAFGMLVVVEALVPARRGWSTGHAAEHAAEHGDEHGAEHGDGEPEVDVGTA